MRKVLQLLVLVLLLTFGFVLPAWAGWTDPKDFPTPSLYAGRVYTRQHYVEFRYDEGAGPRGPLFTGWCSVFDRPDLTKGWTAVGSKDHAYQDADQYLAALGVPQDNGYYIMSPNFWSSQQWTPGAVFPITLSSDNNEELKVPVLKVQSESGIADYTIADPKCFNNGPPGQGFEAGGYQTYTYWDEYHQRYETKTIGWHWFSKQPNSPVYITKEYASRAWSMTETTWGKLCYKYLYNITCSGVEVISVARESGGKDRYAAYFYNTTPFLAKDVKLRAYIVQDGKYTLVDSTTTEIGPMRVGDGGGGP